MCPSLVLAQSPPVINSFTVDESGIFPGGLGTYRYDVTGANSLEIQGVGTLNNTNAGATRFTSSTPVYVLPRGATWSYLDDGSDQGASDVVDGNPAYDVTNWKHPDFDDAAWMSGPAVLGYGDTVDTEVGFIDTDPVTEGDQKNATTYYRHAFSITQGEINALQNLFLELRRDDSGIVYLNGKELVRMNVGDGVVNFDTFNADIGHGGLGNAGAGGAEESFYFTCEISPSDLLAGENTIAVEIHQTSETSSDTRFDFGLYELPLQSPTAISTLGSTWSVLDDGSDLGLASIAAGDPAYDAANWKHPDFDDSAWFSLAGDFGYDTSVINEATVLRFGPNADNADNDADNKFLAYYFRTEFTIADAAELAAILTAEVGLRADDGAIVYINGVEVVRDGFTNGEVTSDSVADDATVNETAYDTFAINQATLTIGTNTIAVEVHQSSATSSDLSFDMDLRFIDALDNTTTKIRRGATWGYMDDGGASLGDTSSNVVAGTLGYDATNWKHPDFDDSSWSSGEGELGYGDTPLTVGGNPRETFTTELLFGDDPGNKFVTTYFRRQFMTTQAAIDAATGAQFSARIDDGAIVYLNGVEIWRANMPAEDPDLVDGTTFANGAIAGDGATASVVGFDKSLLLDGTNTIAVELHQANATSSDSVFDMSMSLLNRSSSVTYTLLATNRFGTDTATVTVNSAQPPASPVYLVGSNPTTVSWVYPEVWSDRALPHAGAYIAYGQFNSIVRAPEGEDSPVFGGSSLELRGTTAQLRLSHDSGTAVIPLITLNGGFITNATGNDAGVGGAGNSIVVAAPSAIGNAGADRILDVSADVSGSSDLTILTQNGANTAVMFTGDNTAFSGNWIVDGTLAPGSATALGSGSITVNDTGTFDAATDLLDPLPNTLAMDVDATMVLDQTVAFASGAVAVDGNVLDDGSYAAADLDALGFGGVFVEGGGRLFIGAVSPDSDGDGLLDAWELSFFPNLAATDGSGDADGDGQNDAAEFASGTSPVDASDLLLITSINQDPGTADVTITWPSKNGVTYRVRFGDLTTMTVIGDPIAGDGTELSFTDDGSLTGAAPSEDDERFYQVIVE